MVLYTKRKLYWVLIMGNLRITLCEDEELFAKALADEIRAFFSERKIPVDLIWHGSGEALKKSLSEAPDLLFMDIELGDADGVELVRSIRGDYPNLPVIFLSGLEERVLDGFDVKAFYFLFKRNYTERLSGILEKFLSEYFYAARIMVKEKEGVRVLSRQEICYVEAEDRSTKIHTQDGVFYDSDSFHAFVKQLPAEVFIEVYHCLCVNVDHISRVDADSLLLDSGETVPVSRRKRKSVVEAVMKRLVAG